MSDNLDLAQDIASSHPRIVARYLEEHPPPLAAAFIDRLSDKASSRILEAMLPFHAAKCLETLSDEAGARYLSAVETRLAAAILRHARDTTRRDILSALPAAAAARLVILLRHPPSVIGAWMNPTILAVPSECRVGEAKARVARDSYADYHRVYVVDAEHRLRGYVRLYHLLQAADTRPITDFLDAAPAALHDSLSLRAALEDEAWRGNDYLPVVDRNDRFVGVLRYADLRAATPRAASRAQDADVGGTFMDLAESYYIGLADVMSTSLAAQPASTGREAR